MLAKLQGFGKGILRWSLRRLFAEGPGATVPPGEIASILVIRTDDRVGNLLLTTPLLSALRAALPKARIGLLCAARLALAVEGTGLWDELWRFEKTDAFRRPWRFVAFCLKLRRARYAVVLEAGHWHAFSFTAAALARWTGARVRIGHRRGEAARLLTHAIEKDPEVAYDAAAKLELLRPLGLEVRDCPRPTTRLGQGEEARRFQALFAAAPASPALIVNPGGRKADHRFPVEAFAQAAAALRRRAGLRIWIAWGPGEEPIASRLLAHLGDEAALLPPTSLSELAGALRGCALFLTNDTGPLHLGVAVGAPTVGVFLTRDWPRWAAPFPEFRAAPVAGLSTEAAVARVVQAGTELLALPVADPTK